MSDVVEVMAKSLKQDDKYWSGWRNTSVNILAALDEAGFTIVPKEAEKHQIDAAYAQCGMDGPDLALMYRIMVEAYQLKGETR